MSNNKLEQAAANDKLRWSHDKFSMNKEEYYRERLKWVANFFGDKKPDEESMKFLEDLWDQYRHPDRTVNTTPDWVKPSEDANVTTLAQAFVDKFCAPVYYHGKPAHRAAFVGYATGYREAIAGVQWSDGKNIDLKSIEKQIDQTLANETDESLQKFIDENIPASQPVQSGGKWIKASDKNPIIPDKQRNVQFVGRWNDTKKMFVDNYSRAHGWPFSESNISLIEWLDESECLLR